jgi:hypothetical protein
LQGHGPRTGVLALKFPSERTIQVHLTLLDILLVEILYCKHLVNFNLRQRITVYPADFEHFLVDPNRFVIILGFTKLIADSLVGINQKA